MVNCHVAHDCQVGDRVIIANGALLAGHVSVADRAFISGNVVIHQFARVGTLAMVGGLARISQDCLPYMITEGSPASARGLEPRRTAARRLRGGDDPCPEAGVSHPLSRRAFAAGGTGRARGFAVAGGAGRWRPSRGRRSGASRAEARETTRFRLAGTRPVPAGHSMMMPC